jgi:pimeloyl-ACP methyl ester carboxylesterase
LKTWCTLVLLGLTSLAFAAPGEAPIGMPGMQAHRIKEPVFDGHAYVYEAGRAHPRTILLVHGIGARGARDYIDHIEWLARSWHVLAVDLPGFGNSDRANVVYSPSNYARFLKHVADRYARKPFVLVGHSMGGVVALAYAGRYSSDLEQLVIADAPGVLHRYAFSSHLLAHLGLSYVPPAIDPLPKLANIARKVLGKVAGSGLEPDFILASADLRASVLGADPARIAQLAVALEDVTPHIAKADMPTLVLWGKDDTLAPLRTGKVLANVLPQARLVTIERAAHVPMVETPERFRGVLSSFLARDVPAAPVPAPPPKKFGDVRCRGKQNLVYEGEYEQLVLNECSNVRIRNARVHELQLNNSTAIIEDSHIGGGEVALYATESVVEITNGRIEGETAIFALTSRFDVAGTDIEASQHVLRAPQPSTIAFSLSRVKSPRLNGLVHHFYSVTAEKPL